MNSPRRIEFCLLDELIENLVPGNPKAHDLTAIQDSVERFGVVRLPTITVDGMTLASEGLLRKSVV